MAWIADSVRLRWLVVLGATTPLLLCEAGLRLWGPDELTSTRKRHDAALPGGQDGALEEDETLGYRPVPGGSLYAEHGALRNGYALEKTATSRRLLFLGDSVTRRAQIVAGLHAELGETCEYWNAGVEGWSTWQEVEYYRRELQPIEADHVVLTFHLNDFLSTPVTFLDGDAVVTVRAHGEVFRPIPWLWELSYFYRFTQYRELARSDKAQWNDTTTASEEIERSLCELRDLTRARGAELTVLVLPWLRERALWPGSLPRKHERVVEMLQRLEIRHFTFLTELDEALAAGEEVQEKPRDPQHPGTTFGRRMARAMIADGFLP